MKEGSNSMMTQGLSENLESRNAGWGVGWGVITEGLQVSLKGGWSTAVNVGGSGELTETKRTENKLNAWKHLRQKHHRVTINANNSNALLLYYIFNCSDGTFY